MRKPTVVTTSWDDGHPADLRLAELLQAHGLQASFYIPLQAVEGRPAMSKAEVRSLDTAEFEIGAHTISHCDLTRVDMKTAKTEIFGCKQRLEDWIEHEVNMFCYPCGRFNAGTISYVREAGYRGARTTRMLAVGRRFSPFQMPTSLQALPHGAANYLKNICRRRDWDALSWYSRELHKYRDWVDLGKRLFDAALASGGVWHLYGHSWEVENRALWNRLEQLFDYVSRRTGVLYATNRVALDLAESYEPSCQHVSHHP